jgi:hypothetical protein
MLIEGLLEPDLVWGRVPFALVRLLGMAWGQEIVG